MNGSRHSAARQRFGFTLVELLVVIVIFAVLVAMIGPSFTAGSDIARVRTAARGVMQMSRYARTMALLHQTPLDLAFTSDGHLSVAPVGGGGGGLVSASSFGLTNAAAVAAEKKAEAAAAPVSETPDAAASGGGSYVMADLAIDKSFEQVAFRFDGYTDSVAEDTRRKDETLSDDETSPEKKETQTARVRYKSNGTCRPYRVRVGAISGDGTSENGESLTVEIDMLGAARVVEDDDR
jgi:prepilin-type N-terminal cleavage/methylation domain-containing protein